MRLRPERVYCYLSDSPPAPALHLTDDVKATSIAAQVMRQLWRTRAAEHPFPTVAKCGRNGRLREHFGAPLAHSG